jgi:anthranilate phosphoribosyltransferase
LKLNFAWVVNSDDGLDEISPYAKTKVVQLKNNSINEFTIDPSELGIKTNNFKKIVGKESEYNSEKIIEIFKGTDNDFSVAVCLNADAGLIVLGKSEYIGEAYS